MKKILVVVDMQNDFIDGPLGTPEAIAIVDRVCEKIREGGWDKIVLTRDTHDDDYLETMEGQKLPIEHCIRNSDGWLLNTKVHKAVHGITYKCEGISIFNKPTFGSLGLVNQIIRKRDSKNIELTLVGVCTDICVISNALLLKAHYPEMKIVVDASCCAGSTPEKHRMALEVMKSCQIDVLNYIPDCGR